MTTIVTYIPPTKQTGSPDAWPEWIVLFMVAGCVIGALVVAWLIWRIVMGYRNEN